jgi:hypothetical protein
MPVMATPGPNLRVNVPIEKGIVLPSSKTTPVI